MKHWLRISIIFRVKYVKYSRLVQRSKFIFKINFTIQKRLLECKNKNKRLLFTGYILIMFSLQYSLPLCCVYTTSFFFQRHHSFFLWFLAPFSSEHNSSAVLVLRDFFFTVFISCTISQFSLSLAVRVLLYNRHCVFLSSF